MQWYLEVDGGDSFKIHSPGMLELEYHKNVNIRMLELEYHYFVTRYGIMNCGNNH